RQQHQHEFKRQQRKSISCSCFLRIRTRSYFLKTLKMIMMKKYYKQIFTGLLTILVLAGCKKLDLATTDRFTELNFWKSSANVNNALNNVYSRLYTSTYYFYNESLSDNAYTRLGVGSGNSDAIAS